jgi:hypothetical protein
MRAQLSTFLTPQGERVVIEPSQQLTDLRTAAEALFVALAAFAAHQRHATDRITGSDGYQINVNGLPVLVGITWSATTNKEDISAATAQC